MDSLLDFLFGNFVTVFIIIAIVSSIWNKIRGAAGGPRGQGGKPGGMPTFGGSPSEPGGRPSPFGGRPAAEARQASRPPVEPDARSLFGEQRDLEREDRERFDEGQRKLREVVSAGEGVSMMAPDAPRLAVTEERAPARRSGYTPPRTAQTAAPAAGADSAFASPSEDDLVKGIIWSEILGPPRSKRPHRR